MTFCYSGYRLPASLSSGFSPILLDEPGIPPCLWSITVHLTYSVPGLPFSPYCVYYVHSRPNVSLVEQYKLSAHLHCVSKKFPLLNSVILSNLNQFFWTFTLLESVWNLLRVYVQWKTTCRPTACNWTATRRPPDFQPWAPRSAWPRWHGQRQSVTSGFYRWINEWMNEWKCIEFKCFDKPTNSRLSLTHHANTSSRWAK